MPQLIDYEKGAAVQTGSIPATRWRRLMILSGLRGMVGVVRVQGSGFGGRESLETCGIDYPPCRSATTVKTWMLHQSGGGRSWRAGAGLLGRGWHGGWGVGGLREWGWGGLGKGACGGGSAGVPESGAADQFCSGAGWRGATDTERIGAVVPGRSGGVGAAVDQLDS